MRDVILFILILIFSVGAASFAPSSASIGATHEIKPVLVQEERQVVTQKVLQNDVDLRKSLKTIEERCDTLESTLMGNHDVAK